MTDTYKNVPLSLKKGIFPLSLVYSKNIAIPTNPFVYYWCS